MFGNAKRIGAVDSHRRGNRTGLLLGGAGQEAAQTATAGDEPAPYMLVDLLGFPDNGYQSQGSSSPIETPMAIS